MNQQPSRAKAPAMELPVRAFLHQLLALCVERNASDLHLVPGLPPYLRVHGILQPQEHLEPISPARLTLLAEELLRPYDRSRFETTGSQDGAFTSPDGSRFRFNVFRRQGEPAIALRKLEDSFRSLAELGLPESLYQLGDLPDGLVVVCGPTGAGKSTTLATIMDRINRTRRCHIVTIEDPIEYIHKPVLSLINQRQVGHDTSSFNDALVASLRQDPDVILVGEIRDLATIRTAITAAETGHLVLTTVHASDCVGAIERLISVFPADEQAGMRRQLSLVLRAIVAQHLLLADGSQGAALSASNGTLNSAPPPEGLSPSLSSLPGGEELGMKAVGSNRTGVPATGSYEPEASATARQGESKSEASSENRKSTIEIPWGITRRHRVVACEILMVTPAIANLVATAKSNQIYSAMETGTALGMQTIEQDLARLWTANLISETTALALARNPSVLRDRANLMRKRRSSASGGVL